MSYRVIIAGGRDFTDYKALCGVCDYLLKHKASQEKVVIVSGACDTGKITFTRPDGSTTCGADGLGEKYATDNGFEIERYPADWKRHGKKAGPLRNRQMAEVGNALIAFWDGESAGTDNMITEAKAKGLLVRIFRYDTAELLKG